MPVTSDPGPGTTPDHSRGPERQDAPGSAGDQDTFVPPQQDSNAVLLAPDDRFEGCWVNREGVQAVTRRNTVNWGLSASCESWAMRRYAGCNYFTVVVQGSEHTAWLVNNDDSTWLEWSDGDLWTRVPIPPPPTSGGAVDRPPLS